jgi:hypothetical protein
LLETICKVRIQKTKPGEFIAGQCARAAAHNVESQTSVADKSALQKQSKQTLFLLRCDREYGYGTLAINERDSRRDK